MDSLHKVGLQRIHSPWRCLLVVSLTLHLGHQATGSFNGGKNCAACTIILSLSEQNAEIHNETIVQGMQRICNLIPESYRVACKGFLEESTPILQAIIYEDVFTPDVGCHALGICYTDAGQRECNLYPKSKQGISSVIKRKFPDPITWRIHKRKVAKLKSGVCDHLPFLKGFCQMIERKVETHLPVIDTDGDRFSTIETLRGTHFRGKDCDDLRRDIHPGRRPIDGDRSQDSNCNGIYGTDKASGKTYEELFCSDVPNYGVVILGDSAGAHFHLPRQWFSAVEMSLASFKDAPMAIADEIDWPHLSAATGYKNSSFVKPWWTDSVYLRLRELNRCNHRDYQNIGVNGADSGSMNDSIQYSMARNRSTDNPLLVIYSLVGNDVCNGHADTIKDMTLPEDMKRRFESTLRYLDTQLPSGSHVIATGLADGRILYDTLEDHIHPLGDWRQDVTYPMVYTYLNCLQASPCAGWMSTNETLRNFTSERAANLSRAVKQVAESFEAKHFDIQYVDYDMQKRTIFGIALGRDIMESIQHGCSTSSGKLMEKWVAGGGKASDMIEPVDGFHPSQVSHFLLGPYLWEKANELFPGAFPRNPHNADIERIFGDQGGY